MLDQLFAREQLVAYLLELGEQLVAAASRSPAQLVPLCGIALAQRSEHDQLVVSARRLGALATWGLHSARVAAIFDTAKHTIIRYSASTIAFCIALLWFISCKKEKDGPQPPSGPPPAAITVTDVDGNIYSTTTIGGQVWMAEDLRTGTYNDGTSIPNLTEGWPWVQATAGAWCYYENDSSHGTIYGKLYNWYAAAHPMICPKGWHVPTDADWQLMEAALGMPADELDQE